AAKPRTGRRPCMRRSSASCATSGGRATMRPRNTCKRGRRRSGIRGMSTDKPLSAVEHIKGASRFLRGTIEGSLADPVTGAVTEEDRQLLKFHGIYQQDDRDIRHERAEQKLEPDYIFMVRIRLPGGILTPAQWLAVDGIAQRYAGGSVRLTTRQSIQLHYVPKRNVKAAMRAIGEAGLSTIAACGDVSRN